MKKYIILILTVLFIADCAAQLPTPSASKTTYLRLKKYNSGARNVADSLNWNMDQIDAGWKTNDTRLDAHDVDIAALDSAIAQNSNWVFGISDSLSAIWINGLYTKVWAGSFPMVHTSYNVNQEQVMFYNAGSSTLTLVDNTNIHTITGNDCVLATGESAIFVKKYTSYWQEVYRSNLSQLIDYYSPTSRERILYNDFSNLADSIYPEIKVSSLNGQTQGSTSKVSASFVYYKLTGDTELKIRCQAKCTNFSSVYYNALELGLYNLTSAAWHTTSVNDGSLGNNYVTKTITVDVSSWAPDTFYELELTQLQAASNLAGYTSVFSIRYPVISVR